MPHSIFVREVVKGSRRAPELLAYDIGTRQEAESLIAGIAISYEEHGERAESGARWFNHNGKMYEIYCWAH